MTYFIYKRLSFSVDFKLQNSMCHSHSENAGLETREKYIAHRAVIFKVCQQKLDVVGN